MTIKTTARRDRAIDRKNDALRALDRDLERLQAIIAGARERLAKPNEGTFPLDGTALYSIASALEAYERAVRGLCREAELAMREEEVLTRILEEGVL